MLSMLLVHQAAIDPIGLFVAFIIIVNILAQMANALKRNAQRREQSQSRPGPAAAAPTTPLRSAAAEIAAARVAQRARLQQALDAMMVKATTETAPVSPPAAVVPEPPPAAAAPMRRRARRMSQPSDQAALPSLPDTLAPMTLDAAQPASLAGTARTQPAAGLNIPAFRAALSGSDLFVAAAIVGPCAALRQAGHTPAGW